MKLFTSIALASALMSTTAMAEIKPGCIGGCMGTAIAAPTPSFPAGYQCNTNWPLGENQVSCITAVNGTAYGDRPHHEPPTYSRPTSETDD